jgi:hypothetical protein
VLAKNWSTRHNVDTTIKFILHCEVRVYINYNTVSGIEYATATHSVRKGSSVGKGEQIYLGRVLDKGKAIF